MSVDNISSLAEQLSPTSFLGKGMAWPPREDPATGDFKRAEAEESISDCLLHLITTSLGEIGPLQNVGTDLDQLLFGPGTGAFVQSVAASITTAINLHEKRVKVLEIRPEFGTSPHGTKTTTINVRYRIIATGKIDNIVAQPPGQGST